MVSAETTAGEEPKKKHAIKITPAETLADLTPRQYTVLSLLAEGQDDKQIGAALRIEPDTVANICTLLYKRIADCATGFARVRAAVWYQRRLRRGDMRGAANPAATTDA